MSTQKLFTKLHKPIPVQLQRSVPDLLNETFASFDEASVQVQSAYKGLSSADYDLNNAEGILKKVVGDLSEWESAMQQIKELGLQNTTLGEEFIGKYGAVKEIAEQYLSIEPMRSAIKEAMNNPIFAKLR
jgi:hypothetical protein